MIPGSVKIFVCTRPVDMRRSFDGLALAAREVIGEDPRSGALFCFVNKRRDRLKAQRVDFAPTAPGVSVGAGDTPTPRTDTDDT